MPAANGALWARAQHIITTYGDEALDHVNDRIHDAFASGEDEALETWLAVADRIRQLTAPLTEGDVKH